MPGDTTATHSGGRMLNHITVVASRKGMCFEGRRHGAGPYELITYTPHVSTVIGIPKYYPLPIATMRTWANAWSSYKDKLIQWIRGLVFTFKRKGQVCPDSKMMAGDGRGRRVDGGEM